MTQEITKKQKCILMRNGIEIWIDENVADQLIDILSVQKESKFIKINNNTINTADISGIFDAEAMEEVYKRKNGQWKCKYNEWHEKFEICACGELKRFQKF